MKKFFVFLIVIVLLIALGVQTSYAMFYDVRPVPSRTPKPTPPPKIPATVPTGFVDATETIPDLELWLMFACDDNFLNRPATGYNRMDVAIMRTQTATALAKANELFKSKGYGICIFDAYRPTTAVADFMAWLNEPDDPAEKARYYPTLNKSELLHKYIAAHSQHSKGYALDLTITHLDGSGLADMGSEYLTFGGLGIYAASGLTQEQIDNRKLLRDTMVAAGFHPIAQEWWHFQIPNSSTTYFGFPIE